MNFTIKNYLSGYFALKMPSPEGTTGDWHPFGENVIPEIAWYGEDYPDRNTLDCLGTYGLWEGSFWLKSYKFDVPNTCFVANHFRAVLDLVKYADSVGLIGGNKLLSEQFIDHPKHKEEILIQALKLAKFYKSEIIYKWVEHEATHSYEFEEKGFFNINILERMAWEEN